MRISKIWSSSTPQAVRQDTLQQIRKGLLESYQERLRSKLAARFPINLELRYSLEGSPTRGGQYENATIPSEAVRQELITLFRKHHGRLLIIGEPGAGKTTLLLQLAHELLFAQPEDQILDIPIIINIATWRERFKTVEDWLNELLPQMGFSKALVRGLLTENRLLPLFDGLDELAADLRRPCLEAIAEYGRRHQAKYVICSRIVEYSETIDAPVYCQLKVQPLSLDQIRAGLDAHFSPETNGILQAINKDPLLAEAIQTPFYLNTVQLLFASMKSWEEFGFQADTLEGRKWEIVDFFVGDAAGRFQGYTPDQVKKYLGFLADRMGERRLVEFELVSLQYDWGAFGGWQLIVAKVVQGVVIGFFVGLVLGPILALLTGPMLGLLLGMFTGVLEIADIDGEDILKGLIQGLIAGLLMGLGSGVMVALIQGQLRVVTRDKTNWSLLYLKREIKKEYAISVITVFAVILIVGPIAGWFFMEEKNGILVGFLAAFLGSLGIIICIGFFLPLLNSQSFLKVNKPYQRFLSSIWSLHFSILQYWHLKGLLHRQSLLPTKLVALLQQATTQNILESDGGSWRFRHQILMEYFARHWKGEER